MKVVRNKAGRKLIDVSPDDQEGLGQFSAENGWFLWRSLTNVHGRPVSISEH